MIIIPLICAVLAGCATGRDQLYYDTTKSISRDNTVAQTACWNSVTEVAKTGDSATRALAIALADRCKTAPVTPEPPRRNWLGF